MSIEGRGVSVSGPKGRLSLSLPLALTAQAAEGKVRVKRSADTKRVKSLHGLYARLVNNMLLGVSRGFEKKLEITGVGYRAQMEGKELVMLLGFSHPIRYSPPEGVQLRTESPQAIVVSGCDREKVGQAAAEIRRFRPPEPYKAKGIRYQGEWVRRKAGKAVAG